jgi:hypothetical protein
MKVRIHTLLMAGLAAAGACSGSETGSASRTSPTDTTVGQFLPAPPGGAKRASYVGLQYDSLPADFVFQGRTMIPPPPNAPRAEYDLAHIRTPRGDMVWLDTIGAPAGDRLRARLVRGALTIPVLAADERLFMASCDVRGRYDPHVVAIVVNEPNVARFTKIRQAWRVDLPSGRFDILPVGGIVCEEVGSG